MSDLTCDFCGADLPEGVGLHVRIVIGPARAERLTARYGTAYKPGQSLFRGACEEHRPLLVPRLISEGFVGE